MIRSMTGYSSVRVEESDFSLVVSLKSINHRFLDLQVRLPPGLEELDPQIRRLVKTQVSRGHLEVTVGLERAGAAELQLNRKLVDAYVATCNQLARDFGCTSAPDPVSLLRIPGMVAAADGAIPPDELERIGQTLQRILAATLDRLNAMRAQEGKALEQDLGCRLEALATLAEAVTRLSSRAPELYRERLETRVRELLEAAPGAAELDAGRLAQEVAYLVSRADVTEELTRFRSHLTQARELLKGATGEVGKKFDFLLQEMNRETNTLLSKAADVPQVGLEMARQAIEMKAEIEKLREQTQNIE